MNRSLRHRLTRDLLIATLGLGGLGFSGLYVAARFAVRDQFDLALQARAVALSSNTQWIAGGLQVSFDARNFPPIDDDETPDFYELTPTGRASPLRSASLRQLDLPLPRGATAAPRFWNLALPNGQSGRAIALRFTPRGPDKDPPEVTLVLAVDRDDLDETYSNLVVFFAAGGLFAAGAIVVLVPRVLRRGLAPLDVLGRQVARIDAGSLSARFPADELPAELVPIGTQLNHLLSRLEQSFARERRFSADLAHELRTPVAELRMLAECALKWPAARDEATDRDTLAIARHLENLVARLLELVRSEHGRIRMAPEPVDLADLIDRVWRSFEPRALARSLAFEFDVAPIRIESDPLLMKSILGNLFDNAIDYTAGGETVRVTLAAASGPDGVALTITNRPVSVLTPRDVDQIFDPFWRHEAARSDTRHAGLGLSLSRSFAHALGWTLIARLESDGRLAFVLTGPSSPPK